MISSNKISLFLKKSAALLSLFIVAMIFQNFTLATIQSYLSISPENISVAVASHKYDRETNTTLFHVQDSSSGRIHEAKVQGEGEVPYAFLYKQQNNIPVVAFEINNKLDKPISNDRSEMRLVGTNSYFGETYYTSFNFFYPSSSTPIINKNGLAKDWGLIWQCAQIGGGSSPPLSLHIENDILSMTTITDYRTYVSTGKPYYNNQPLSQIIRNKWYNVMIRYSLGPNGSYSVWIDGKKVKLNADYNVNKLVDTKYLPIGFKDVLSPEREQLCTIRYGLYKKSAQGSFKILFRDLRFGTSYNQVHQAN